MQINKWICIHFKRIIPVEMFRKTIITITVAIVNHIWASQPLSGLIQSFKLCIRVSSFWLDA